jgi:hypothetical protein
MCLKARAYRFELFEVGAFDGFRTGGPATLVLVAASPAARCLAAGNDGRESRIAHELFLEIRPMADALPCASRMTVTNSPSRSSTARRFVMCGMSSASLPLRPIFAAICCCDVVDEQLRIVAPCFSTVRLELRFELGARLRDAFVRALSQSFDVALLRGGIFGSASRGS